MARLNDWLATRPRRVACFAAALLLAALIFTLFPGLDIWTSHWFWSPERGWFMTDRQPFRLIFVGLPILTQAIAIGLVLLLALILLHGRAFGRFDLRNTIFLLANLALGPGLFANTILKDHWGRARPGQIVEFGGLAHFTPALLPTNQCASNCSFVSGHGSMAFSLIAFAFIMAPGVWRTRAIWLALGFGVLTGVTRIVQGAHFLSDTVFAAFFMIGLAWLLHFWIVEKDGLAAPWVGKAAAGIGHVAARIFSICGRPAWRPMLVHGAVVLAFVVSVLWLDRPIANAFHGESWGDGQLLVHWLRWVTNWGEGVRWLVPSGLAVIACLVIARSPKLYSSRERWTAWALVPGYIFLCVALSGIAADIVKVIVGRTRPKLWFQDQLFTWDGPAWHADHWSFPSGHSATVASVAVALALIWPRHVAAYWLLAGLVMFSRVALDQHYLSDVIAGTWLGIMTSIYLAGVLRRSGRPLADAVAGVMAPVPPIPWRYRLLGWAHRGSP